MRFNPISREIVCKVVYYGPGLAGKTTNMQWVRDHVPREQASDLVSVDTHSERTLHFDWLALELGQVQGVNVRFEFYTVPGQNYYAATRRQVLQAADGVVFVADSRREALDENIDSMNEMLNNLRHHGLPDDLPVVMQYNKQDLSSALRREQLEPLMNVRGWPSFASTAPAGEGVLDTVRAVTQLVAERLGRAASSLVPEEAPPTAAPQSWLISCYRCQTILEVPTAALGSVYTCGVCGSTLEVTDTERGLTRAPSSSQDDSGGYALQPSLLPDAGMSALAGQRTQPIERPVAVADANGFDLEGYELVASLDESVQGRRARVREAATGRVLRAYTIAPQLMRQPGFRDNLEPYVRMAGPIKHPNVLPLANLRPTHDSAVLLSADPPDHEPLAHVLARRRALAPPHAMGLLRQMALALEEAARHGVVHGWLRPDVILVSPDGNVLIDELCLPKNHRYLVRELAGASAATEYYLAPEHLGDDTRSDLRSDIFSLGALLFRMVTGEGLVTGYSAHEALHKVIANGPRPLRSTQAGVSRDLDLFYQRMVASERKDRFQTYREVIEALDRFGGGAKRQTLKLTGSVAAGSGGGTGRVQRSSAGAHIARRAGGGSGSYAGRPRTGGSPQTGSIRKKDDSGVVVAVVVVCVLIAVVLLAVVVMNQNHTPTTVDNDRPSRPPPHMAGPGGTTTVGATAGAATGGQPLHVAAADPVKPPQTGGEQPEQPAAMTPAQRVDLKRDIASKRVEGRFSAALELAAKIDSADERDQLQKTIVADHDQRKKDLEKVVADNSDLDFIKKLLVPAQTDWGMPGDVDWANDLIAKSGQRIAAAQTQPDNGAVGANDTPKQPDVARSPLTGQPLHVAPAGDPTQPAQPTGDPAQPAQPPFAFQPLTDPVAQVDATVDQALLAYAPSAAAQALGGLDPQAAEGRALKHKIDWWSKRAALIARGAQAKVKMRLPNASGQDPWDVVGAPDSEHVEVAAPTGTRSTLPWTQFQPKDIAKVFGMATDAPDATGEDSAIAVVMHLLANDTTSAALQMKTHKAQLDADLSAELETLVVLHKRRDLLDTLARANESVKNGNAKGAADALSELKHADRGVRDALAPQIQRLEEAQGKLAAARPGPATGGTGTTPPQGKDKLTFDGLDDLESLPDRDGKWQVNGGMLNLTGDGTRVGRRDLGSAKSLSLRFLTKEGKGTLSVDFRGAKVVIDFASSNYTVSGKGQPRPKGFAIIPKVPYTMLLERKDDAHTTLTFANGTETAEIGVADLSDLLTISVDGGAQVALDELEIFREGKSQSLADKQRALKQATGWEAVGGAYLDPPSIELPANPGSLSGISTPVRDGVTGYSFEVKGVGKLEVRLVTQGDNKTSKFAKLEVDLPKNAQEQLALTVRWTDKGFALYDQKGDKLGEQPLSERPSNVSIMAGNKATMTVPRVEYKAP